MSGAGRRPVIGLTGRRKQGKHLVGNPETLGETDFDMYYSAYARAVLDAGGMPMHLPIDVSPAEAADYVDGLLLSGGTDVDPALYGADPDPDLQSPEADRDAFEMGLLDQVAERKLPTLGICRGIQMINVHAGGTLHQHVPEHAGFDQPTTHLLHEISVEADSLLGGFYGERHPVNSLHHQTLDRVGAGFRVTARGDDGTIEGIEHESRPIVAVQWHPEMLPTAPQDPLFTWLVQAAGE